MEPLSNIATADIYICKECGTHVLEFEKHVITQVDEYGRPIHMRQEVQVVCKYCKKPALLVKRDKKQMMIDEAMGKPKENIINETIVEDNSDNRNSSIKWKGYF